jgi:hypothetical protein
VRVTAPDNNNVRGSLLSFLVSCALGAMIRFFWVAPMEAIRQALGVPVTVAFMLGAPVTYILAVVDTWQSGGNAFLNIVINLTLDVFLAAIWPITWLLWFFWEMMGWGSPLSRVLGIF